MEGRSRPLDLGNAAVTSAAFAVLLLLAAQPAAATEGWFTTAEGVRLRTPAVDRLDCETMRAVLDAIDASGYRDGAPAPRHAADMALLEYEHRLSSAYYADCVRDAADSAQAEGAFRDGYEGD
jgi:hypothetical protein